MKELLEAIVKPLVQYPDEVNGKPITRDDFSVSVPIPEGYAGYQG